MFESQLLNEIAGALSILLVGLTAIVTLDQFLKWQHSLHEKEGIDSNEVKTKD